MRAPPPESSALALSGPSWEEDLSRILSEASAPQQQQQQPLAVLQPAVKRFASGGVGGDDQTMMVMAGFDGIGDGEEDEGGATGSGRRRRGEFSLCFLLFVFYSNPHVQQKAGFAMGWGMSLLRKSCGRFVKLM